MKKKFLCLFSFIFSFFLSIPFLTACNSNNTEDKTYRLIIAGMTDTPERRESIDFTDSYYQSELVLVTNKTTLIDSNIRYTDDQLKTILKGKHLVSQTGTVTDDMIHIFVDKYGAIKDNSVDSFTTAAMQVETGKSSFAFTAELPVAQSYVNKNENLQIMRIDNSILGEELNNLSVSIGIAKGQNEFKKKVNNALKKISNEQRLEIMTDMVNFNSNANEDTDNIGQKITGENGTIIIGLECNYPSFNWTRSEPNNYTYPIQGKSNEFAEGYDVEIAKLLAKELNMNLEIQKMEWDALLPWALIGSDINVNTNIISDYAAQFGYGIITTLFLALIGTGFGLILGLFLGIGRTLKTNPNDNKFVKTIKQSINFICYIYILVLRGTPMLIQGLIFFLAIPMIIPIDWVNMGNHVIFNGYFYCGSIVIVLNTAAYIGEIIRGGINSIDKGQYEAGRALGLSHFQTMKKIILPQALKNSIPSIGNEFIVNIKDSSVLNVIGLTELYGWGKIILSQTYNAIAVYAIVAAIYLVMTLVFSLILKIVEKKLNNEIIFNISYFRHFKFKKEAK